MRQAFLCIILITLCGGAAGLAAADFRGAVEATLPDGPLQSGTSVTVQLAAVDRDKRGVEKRRDNEALDGRPAHFFLTPYRFNLHTDASTPVPAEDQGQGRWRLDLPDLPADWYLLTVGVADDDGDLPTIGRAIRDSRHRDRFVHRQVVGLQGDQGAFLRVHTERARSVFNTGEMIRLYCSSAGPGSGGAVTLLLEPVAENGRDTAQLHRGEIAADATLAVDLPPAATRAIAPGFYDLVLRHGDRVADRYRLQFLAPEQPAGGGRWAHTMPFGFSGGLDGDLVDPDLIADGSYRGMIDRVLKRIHHANFWVQFFANRYPILAPEQPAADRPGLPPVAAQYRPTITDAFHEALMAEGVALGICSGYGEDYKAEVYMPLPTVIDEDMAVFARKYLTAGLGAARFPHFTALYTDYYGHADFTGAGEISSEQMRELRETLWREACAAAGIEGAAKPHRYPQNRKDLPDDLQQLLNKDKQKRKSWDAWWKEQRSAHDGDRDWFENLPDEAARRQTWEAAWRAAGVSPVPEPPTYIPLPELDEANTERFGKDAAYAYASYALRGVERCYRMITETVESELPAVFTIHNKGAMNHSSVGHAWTGTRTPNIDPAYCFGATALSVSEWNLDSVPKPYFLPTFYVQPQLDAGRPVYQCGLWKQMGMPSRFMRDAVFWAGRGIQTYFDQTSNMTWAHRGADQTTYASNERMSSVTEFLSYHNDLVHHLAPVREVGIYVPPKGGPWGTGVTRGHFIATIASLMSGYQVHMVNHAQLDDPVLAEYPLLYAPSIHGPDEFFPFEERALKDYIAGGGRIVVSQAPNYYHPPEAYEPAGISASEQPQIDEESGEPKRHRDGTAKTETVWQESREQWAQVTRDYVWGAFPDGIVPAAINVHDRYTHRDESGEPATWDGKHWTGHHKWAPLRGSALDQFAVLQAAYASVLPEPLVQKDQPEVFVDVRRPRDAKAQATYVFASNWTLPTHPDLFRLRVPQGMFNSGVQPVTTELAIRAPDTGAVYDLIDSRPVPFERRGDRIVFTAHLASVEGRIFALYPRPAASLDLHLPTEAAPGSLLQVDWTLRDADGAALPVLGSFRLQATDAAGAELVDLRRAASPGHPLPAIRVPGNAGDQVRVFLTDTVTGLQAAAAVQIVGPAPLEATVADPVTIYRGDRIHRFLNDHAADLAVLLDDGAVVFAKDGSPEPAGEGVPTDDQQRWAAAVAAALGCPTVANTAAVTAPLHAHPWKGRMAGARTRGTVPSHRIEQPLVVVGDPRRQPYLQLLERATVAGRSLGPDNVGPGRAVIAWAPRCFSPGHDSLLVAVQDQTGLDAALAVLKELRSASRPDPATAARERMRAAWLPGEVRRFKTATGTLPTDGPTPLRGDGAPTRSRDGWQHLATALGTAVFDIDASAGGIAVGTKSWAKPLGLLRPDGAIVGFWGGEVAITPRDVGVGPDGAVVAGGFSLFGSSAAWRADGTELFRHRSGISHSSDNPFGWDSFKDSDRHLAVAPDHRTFLAVASDAIIAYDATSGSERWRIPCTQPPGRPQGLNMPEMAFSPDGQLALITSLEDAGQRSVELTVTKQRRDERGRFNKRDTYEETVTVTGELQQRFLQLVRVADGSPVWRRCTGIELVDRANELTFWDGGRASAYEQIDGRWKEWEAVDEATPRSSDGTPLDAGIDPLTIPFWHLYSSVGPGGAWTLIGTRDAAFLLLDEQGTPLRAFDPKQLPGELDPGHGIPPSVAVGDRPDRLLLYAAESRSLFVTTLHIGSQAQRQQATALQAANRATMAAIKEELKNSKNYRSYGDKVYLQAFAERIDVPAELEGELIDRMGRVPAERRAKRKRDYRWFEDLVGRIEVRLFEDDRPALDAAVGLRPDRRIDLPARIADLACDGDLTVAYVSGWDQRIRAVELDSGTVRWTTPVIGGCRLDLVEEAGALYAGGSRGDVYRIDPSDGSIAWSVNVSAASNALAGD